MAILSFNNISQSFGGYHVFQNLSASIPNNAKIGLVGPNGIGKTSLLLILSGIAPPTDGSISIAQGLRIGYLRQEAMDAFAQRNHSVYEEMLTVFSHLKEMEAKLDDLAEQMALDPADEIINTYGKLQERFELAGGYDYELQIEQVLYGLGFKKDHWDTALSHLSGGQKTRALLARLILQRPDLLILDEPTNHLDVNALEWLEGILRAWDGVLLIVSHDRYFLDRTVNTIWEMTPNRLNTYRGNYTAYLRQRAERHERTAKEWEAMLERFEQEMAYIDKHYASQRHDMAEGKLKRIGREVAAVHSIGIEALHIISTQGWAKFSEAHAIKNVPDSPKQLRAAIKSLENPITDRPTLRLNLHTTERSGDIVLHTRQLEVGYTKPIFIADDIRLRRSEIAALIGPNGAGKTTLLRTLLREIDPLSGTIEFGLNVKIGYFAQAQDNLNPEKTILDELLTHHPNMPISESRHYLARYLFRNDDVFKSIKSLSGGERGRLALALLALNGANFLLLDEPTNHLDVHAQEVLQEVLEQFDGTILLVSHDRYLVNRLATQIWDLQDGLLQVFRGSYQDYLAAREKNKASTKLTHKSVQI